MKRYRPWMASLTVAIVIAYSVWHPAAGQPQRRAGAQLSSARDQAAALQNESVGGPFTSLCTSAAAFASNVMTNCDSTLLPHNETAIAADPYDADHFVGGSNDTELAPNGASFDANNVVR